MTFEEFIGDRVNVLSPQEYNAVEDVWNYQQNHIERLERYLTDAKNALKERRQIIEHQRNTIADLTEKLDIERNRTEELEGLLKAYDIQAYSEGYQEGKKECLLEEPDRCELEQAIMSCWGITDDLQMLMDEFKDQDHFLLESIKKVYEMKFEKLFKEFNKFTGCY